MGRLNQRQKNYAAAYNNYSIVVAKAKDSKTLDNYTKRLNKMKTKLDKQYKTTKTSSAVKKNDSKIHPVNVKKTNATQKSGSTVDYSPKTIK